MTKVFSLFNQCGGASKTTLTFNLGYHLSQLKSRVLLIDLDAQGSLTRLAKHKVGPEGPSVYDALLKGLPLPILKDVHGMDVVPADRRLYKLDLIIGQGNIEAPALLLRKCIEKIAAEYDYILIDCPPNLGMSSVNALVANTHVLIPIETALKGLEGVEELFATIREASVILDAPIKIGGIIPVFFDSRTSASATFLEAIKKFESKTTVFPAIPTRIDFDYAWGNKEPLGVYDPKNKVLPIFKKIAKKLKEM